MASHSTTADTRKQRPTVDRVLDGAIARADQIGVHALRIRRLAEALDTSGNRAEDSHGGDPGEDVLVRDDLGHEVRMGGPPVRVVSLVPSITEAIAVTCPQVLVGATDWCTHPAHLDVHRVRGPKNPDLGLIEGLRPDLVVANQEENRRVDVDRLRAARVAVWVTRIDSVGEALASLGRLLRVGFGLGAEPRWVRAHEEYTARLPKVALLTGHEVGDVAHTGDAREDLLAVTAVHPMREAAVRRLLVQDGASWALIEELLAADALRAVEHAGERFYLRPVHGAIPAPRGIEPSGSHLWLGGHRGPSSGRWGLSCRRCRAGR